MKKILAVLCFILLAFGGNVAAVNFQDTEKYEQVVLFDDYESYFDKKSFEEFKCGAGEYSFKINIVQHKYGTGEYIIMPTFYYFNSETKQMLMACYHMYVYDYNDDHYLNDSAGTIERNISNPKSLLQRREVDVLKKLLNMYYKINFN